jgi:hypothetical protein
MPALTRPVAGNQWVRKGEGDMDPKEPPPANEDRKSVDPQPPGVDPERKEQRPSKPGDGAEVESAPDSPDADVSHSE